MFPVLLSLLLSLCHRVAVSTCRRKAKHRIIAPLRAPWLAVPHLALMLTTRRPMHARMSSLQMGMQMYARALRCPMTMTLASPPSSAAAGEPFGDPRVFAIIIIFFPYWWLSCNKLFSLSFSLNEYQHSQAERVGLWRRWLMQPISSRMWCQSAAPGLHPGTAAHHSGVGSYQDWYCMRSSLIFLLVFQ